MTVKTLGTTLELTEEDGEMFEKLNRARTMMFKVCEICDLDAGEAMNLFANLLVVIAIHECATREQVVTSVGAVYDERLKIDAQDETLN